jgi:hypothetical protein
MKCHIQTNTWNILYKQIHGTSYTNKYMEHLIQTNTWDIIYKQIHGTPYTNKYMEHLIQTNTWNIYTNRYMEQNILTNVQNIIYQYPPTHVKIRSDNNSSTCTFTTGTSVTYALATVKVSRIEVAFATILLCLHVLFARGILLIENMLIIFSEYRCLKR